MDKNALLEFLKKEIAIKFAPGSPYSNLENSENIYRVLTNLNSEIAYDIILQYLNALKDIEGINDNDILYAINIADENLKLEQRLEILKFEKTKKGYYDASDLAIVRDTDFLPDNGNVSSISNIPFVCKSHLSTKSAIYVYLLKNDEILKSLNEQLKGCEERSKEFFELLQKRNEREEFLRNEANEISPFATQYRSSIHFCLNGIVKSHGKGTFNGKFVIIDSFAEHELDPNILSVRPEDTYFKDRVKLSNKAVILVNEKDKHELENFPDIDKYRIVVFRGDKKAAVERELIKMGIVPEEVEEHNIAETPTSKYIHDYISKMGYGREKHFGSQFYNSDDSFNPTLWQMYENEFFKYLMLYITDENKKQQLDEVMKDYFSDKELLLISIINDIGMDNFKKITNEFNDTVIRKINEGNFPTNNELLSGERTLAITAELSMKL